MVTEEEQVRCRESQLDSDAQHLKRCENALKSEAKRVKQRLSQAFERYFDLFCVLFNASKKGFSILMPIVIFMIKGIASQ